MICSKCGKDAQPTNKYNTGYGKDSEGNAFCFDCCADLDRKAMQETGKHTLYLTKKDNRWTVTNWPGTLVFDASVTVHKHGHFSPFAGYLERRDCWFCGPDGRLWHGRSIGDWTEIAHCERLKDTEYNRQCAEYIRAEAKRRAMERVH